MTGETLSSDGVQVKQTEQHHSYYVITWLWWSLRVIQPASDARPLLLSKISVLWAEELHS